MTTRDGDKLPTGLRAHQKKRRDASRAAILDAAADLFCARGYVAVSVAEIAKAAKVSPATFYKVFPSKEAALRAVAERELALARAPFLDGVPSFDSSKTAMRFVAERMRVAYTETRIPALTRIAIAEGAQLPDLTDLYRLPDGREPTQALGELVMHHFVAQGLFVVPDVPFAVRQILGMLGQGLIHEPLVRGREIEDLDGYLESCVQLFCMTYASRR